MRSENSKNPTLQVIDKLIGFPFEKSKSTNSYYHKSEVVEIIHPLTQSPHRCVIRISDHPVDMNTWIDNHNGECGVSIVLIDKPNTQKRKTGDLSEFDVYIQEYYYNI